MQSILRSDHGRRGPSDQYLYLPRERVGKMNIVTLCPTPFDAEVATLDPSQLCKASVKALIVCGGIVAGDSGPTMPNRAALTAGAAARPGLSSTAMLERMYDATAYDSASAVHYVTPSPGAASKIVGTRPKPNRWRVRVVCRCTERNLGSTLKIRAASAACRMSCYQPRSCRLYLLSSRILTEGARD